MQSASPRHGCSARGPEEDALERVEVGPGLPQSRQEALPVPLQEARPERGGHPPLVVGQGRAAYPFHHVVPRSEAVPVDLQPYRLLAEAEPLEQRGVRLRREDGRAPREAAERVAKRLLARYLDRGGVREVVVVGGDLDGELAALGQRAGQPGQQRLVIGNPVQRGIGEDSDHTRPRPARERRRRCLLCGRTTRHRRMPPTWRAWPASCRSRPSRRRRGGDAARGSARPCRSRDRPRASRAGLHQVEQVVERARPLVAKAGVLLGVPVGRG